MKKGSRQKRNTAREGCFSLEKTGRSFFYAVLALYITTASVIDVIYCAITDV